MTKVCLPDPPPGSFGPRFGMADNSAARRQFLHLRDGGGLNGTTRLNRTTVQNDASAADQLKGSAPPTPNLSDLDWLFTSTGDLFDALVAGEIRTAI